jgi:hypothetical protein
LRLGANEVPRVEIDPISGLGIGIAAGGGMSNGAWLINDAANTLAQRNAGNAQRFNLYGTFTNSSNYERMFLEYNTTGTAYRIGTEKAGTGSARALELQTDGVTRLTIASSGAVTITGNTLPTTTGTNGQVLTTNGSGTVTWQTPASTGSSATVIDPFLLMGG